MAVVVEVTNERRLAAGVEHPLFDFRNRRCRILDVDGHPHHVRTGRRELDALLRGGFGIRRVGKRHRLHDDRRAAADLDAPHFHAHRFVKTNN